jgi:UPF0755 protein
MSAGSFSRGPWHGVFGAALGLVLLAAALGGGGAWWALRVYDAPGPTADEVVVVLPRGVGLPGIAERLHQAGVIAYPEIWALTVKALGEGQALKAGEYRFKARVTPREATLKLREGDVVIRRLTVPEGLSARQALALIAATEGLEGPTPDGIEEGSLLPETYRYSWGDQRAQIVERMRRGMAEAIDKLWLGRADNLPYKTRREALVLASIVEKETGLASERPRIASVFVNRLRLGMKLQSDPTVIYGLTKGAGPLDRPLSRADLAQATPWNTYAIDGLPPTPIALPGIDAIRAVLNPDRTDELYFVADGSGGHAFAKTLADHNRNVARYRALQQGERK